MSQGGYLKVSGHDESHFRNVGTGLPSEENDDYVDHEDDGDFKIISKVQ